MEQRKLRANAVLTTSPVKADDGKIVGIRLALANGAAWAELLFEKCHAAVLNRFLYEGALKRLGDAAAAKTGTAPLKRFEPIARLAQHYSTGTAEWELRVDHAAVAAAARAKAAEQKREYIVEAVAAAAGITYEQARRGLQKRAAALSLPLSVIIDSALSSKEVAKEFVKAETARAAAAQSAQAAPEFDLNEFDFGEGEAEGENEGV